MRLACAHFKLADFVRPGESYHFARTDVTENNAVRYHDHDYHEVFWTIRGHGEHLLNRRARPLDAGFLILIHPRDRHRVTGLPDEPIRLINVAFPSRTWVEVRRRYFASEPDWFELPENRRMWPLEARAKAALAYWADRLAGSQRRKVDIDGFLMELPRLRPAVTPSRGGPMPSWLARARRDIARPEQFSGGTRALAHLAGRSPSHVARATVRWLGQTPTDLINAARMDYAAGQLAETDRPILEIVFDCGLANLSHFYALFRRRFGVSPRRYRLQAHPTVRG